MKRKYELAISMIHYMAITAVNINMMVIWNVTPHNLLFR